MAKEKEKKLARDFYINLNLNKKQISERIGVAERTIHRWIKQENWDEILVAKISSDDYLINDLKESIVEMVKKRLEMNNDPNATANDKAKLTDEISKINKALDSVRKSSKPSLTNTVHIIEHFMNSLKKYDEKLYLQIVDFHVEWLKKQAEII